MPETNETYARIQSLRIKNLEKQVHLMRRELQRLRQGMLNQNDVEKLSCLLERLKELNVILIDLRNYYNCMQQSNNKRNKMLVNRINPGTSHFYTVLAKEPDVKNNAEILETNARQKHNLKTNECLIVEHKREHLLHDSNYRHYSRENAGYDQRELSPETSNESLPIKQKIDIREASNDSFKTCKELMDENKPPSSILGNYILRLQDFRADPELKRKRWEKKQQEKLKQLRQRKLVVLPLQDKATLTEERSLTNSFTYSTGEVVLKNPDDETIKENKDFISKGRYNGNTSSLAISLPVVKYNLSKIIDEIINDNDRKDIVLTIVLENDLYHVSISQKSNSHTLACFLATEEAIHDARQQHIFQDLLTFFVVNAENSKSRKDRILGHLFEFIKLDIK